METQKIKISKLKNNTGQIEGLPKNPRFIKDDKFKKLVKSIQEDPEMMQLREVIAYDNGGELIVIAGNMRLRACIEIGITEIHCKILPKETPIDKLKAYTIKDNVSFGSHDFDLLANEWDVDLLVEWGIDLPDIDLKPDVSEDDFNGQAPKEPITVLGDLYEIGEHKLLCGNSTETDNWQKICGENRFDLIVTDPPYNVNYSAKNNALAKYRSNKNIHEDIENDKMDNNSFYQFLYDFYTALGAYTKAGGGWYVWHADTEGVNFRKAMIDSGIMLKQCLIWVKQHIVLGRQDYQWKHEPCLYGWKEGAAHGWFSDRKQTTILNFDKPQRNDEHPTMKPVALFAYQIGNSSKQGDIVGDGFLGSGTTMVASHQLNRKCYGMELSPKYCDVIISRMITLDENLQIKRNGILLSKSETEKFILNTSKE